MGTTVDIEAAVDRVDHGLSLLIDKRHSLPVTHAIEISLLREGEKLYRHHGRDALIDVAMLVVIRNPDSSRYARITLLEDLWSAIDTQQAPSLAFCDIPATTPRSDSGDGEVSNTEITMKKAKKVKSRKAAKKAKRIAAHKQAAAVKRSA